MKARERARVAQFVQMCRSSAVLVYDLAFLLLESSLLCLDAWGAAGRYSCMPSQSPLERQRPLALHHELHTKREAAVPLGGWPPYGVERFPGKGGVRKNAQGRK
jgi:hypothetical protein